MDEVSCWAKRGESSTCMTMAGTPPKVVIRSRSISSRARSGSKWCIITIFPPAPMLPTMTAWQPVAWKSGTESRIALCTLPEGSTRDRAEAQLPARVDEEEVHQVGADVAVRADGALGASRGARGVEDGGVVLRVDGDVGGRGVGVDVAERQCEGPFGHRCRPVRRLADGGGVPGCVAVRCSSATIRAVKPGQPAEEGADALGPLRVDEGDLGTRVLQPVAQLLAGPPGVERDDDGPGQGDGPEGHDPLGQVAHGDGDPVALGDAELVSAAGGPACRRSGSARRRWCARPRRPGRWRRRGRATGRGRCATMAGRSSRCAWRRRGCRAPPSRTSGRARSGWRWPRRWRRSAVSLPAARHGALLVAGAGGAGLKTAPR